MSLNFYGATRLHKILYFSAGGAFHECRFDSFTTQQHLLLARIRVFIQTQMKATVRPALCCINLQLG